MNPSQNKSLLSSSRVHDDPKHVREIVTPEGVPLRFVLARGGDRATAFAMDLFLQAFLLTLTGWGLQMATGGGEGWLTALMVVLSFLFTTFYFAVLEVRWQGQTWGKRMVGIRVIDARGGQLETRAVLARNLMRELELWTPVRFIVAHKTLWPDAPGWAVFVAGAWTFIVLLFPLFNKDTLRIGDVIAGTRVVVQPKYVLLPDLVAEAFGTRSQPPRLKTSHAFTDVQLGHYGIYELQVLENVLRGDPSSAHHYNAMTTVSEKVRIKIGFTANVVGGEEQFLKDFYAAQRAFLEHKLLLGQRREDKYGVTPPAKR